MPNWAWSIAGVFTGTVLGFVIFAVMASPHLYELEETIVRLKEHIRDLTDGYGGY